MASYADVLLVAVTPIEVAAIRTTHKMITGRESREVTRNERKYFDLGLVNQASVYLIQSEMGSAGSGASHDTIRRAIAALRPTSIIMVGIAFGMKPDKQEVGTILVSDMLIPYELQRVGATHTVARGPRPESSARLRAFFRARQTSWTRSDVQFGQLFTGEKLVDNPTFRASLAELAPEALGGEMEGSGLYAAAHGERVDWIVVKAISDWADGLKSTPDKSRHQRKSAVNAAEYTFDVLTSTDMVMQRSEPVPPAAHVLDWRCAGGFDADDPLLKRLPAEMPPGKTRYELCREEIAMSMEDKSEKAFAQVAIETFDRHVRRRSGGERIRLQDARSALLLAHELMVRYASLGQKVRGLGIAAKRKVALPRYFERVYPNTVNTFVKDIIHLSQNPRASGFKLLPREAEIAAASKYIIRTAQLKTTRAPEAARPEVHAAYTLGRIISPGAKVDAKTTLHQFEERATEQLAQIPYGDDDQARQFYLMRRTAMLSLAMLGEAEAAQRYLKLLLTDRIESDVNAGFHLEYYGDQSLDETLPLCSRDLGGPCENTLHFLAASLTRSLDRGWDVLARPLAAIELYTFTSILARRFDSPHQDIARRMISILERAREHLEDDDLKLYVSLCIDIFVSPANPPARRIGQYFSARNAPRNGWVHRGVVFPETVGSHTAGAIWLVNLIPEADAEHLRVGRIRDMLEVHDLAEGITGDITPDARSEDHPERERRLVREFSWLGTYLRPQVDLYQVYVAYAEFHEHRTEEAKIAHEIDALDIILQGQSILQSSAACERDRIEALMVDMERRIKSPTGRQLLTFARQMNVISESSFQPTPPSTVKEYFFRRASRSMATENA